MASNNSTADNASNVVTLPTSGNRNAPAPTNGKKLSKFRLKQIEKGRDQFIVEGPIELIDMMRVAAKNAGDMSVAGWAREALADVVNSLNLTHEVTDPKTNVITVQPWQFDKKNLESRRARTRLKDMTPEQKAKHEERKKADAKQEREWIKEKLREHREELRAKIKGNS